jgi:membrane fusion protein (multidrug efflux system)
MAESPIENLNTEEKPHPNNRSKRLWQFSGLLLALAFFWFLYWFFYLQYHEWTDDAYANGSMININSAVPGSVIAFYADNTDLVSQGQLLVELDKTDYKIAYNKTLSTLAATVLQVKQLYDTVLVNQSRVENAQIALARATFDYENRLSLVELGGVSREDFVHSKDTFLQAEILLELAKRELQVALDARGNTPIDTHPLIEEQKAQIRKAYYNLHHCSIFAPVTGYVAKRSVEVGMHLSPTTNLMAIIPQDYVWVDANFKETQLTRMRIGQPATVTFDIYGSDVIYKGTVLGIASGSGSVFSLIPPQNATGNWIKIVQRLPVRISLDPEVAKKYPSRLGISASVNVDITNQDLPMLATAASTKPVEITQVFNIDFTEVNKEIDEILHEKLKSSS